MRLAREVASGGPLRSVAEGAQCDQQDGEALRQSKQVSEAATQRHSGEARSENLHFHSASWLNVGVDWHWWEGKKTW